MSNSGYMEEYTDEDDQICQDFNWEHITVEEEPAIKLYLTNAKGEPTYLGTFDTAEQASIAFETARYNKYNPQVLNENDIRDRVN